MSGFDSAIREWVKWSAYLIGLAFAAFFFMDTRHAHPPDVLELEAKVNRKIMMKESTRYAEVCAIYSAKLEAGIPIEDWERWRWELCQSEQKAIRDALLDEE